MPNFCWLFPLLLFPLLPTTFPFSQAFTSLLPRPPRWPNPLCPFLPSSFLSEWVRRKGRGGGGRKWSWPHSPPLAVRPRQNRTGSLRRPAAVSDVDNIMGRMGGRCGQGWYENVPCVTDLTPMEFWMEVDCTRHVQRCVKAFTSIPVQSQPPPTQKKNLTNLFLRPYFGRP